MPKSTDLVGCRFGSLIVLERLSERENKYFTWRCKCNCGREVIVNTKRLTRGTVTDCGCISKKDARSGPIAEDLTGQRFGKLLVLRKASSTTGRTKWLCQCDCGEQCCVAAQELKAGKTRSCGCLKVNLLMQRKVDLCGRTFNRLTVLYPTDLRDKKGSVYWHCRCICGTELDVTQDALVHGHYRSCGCLKRELQGSINKQLTFVEGTCVELLKFRKERNDNTSGFRGVSQTSHGKWKVSIGMQGQRYYLGTFPTFEAAVRVRMEAEKLIHDGFVKAYQNWSELAQSDPSWAEDHPFFFRVGKTNGSLFVESPLHSVDSL